VGTKGVHRGKKKKSYSREEERDKKENLYAGGETEKTPSGEYKKTGISGRGRMHEMTTPKPSGAVTTSRQEA